MKSIAFVFTRAPHGNSCGREGLDAALATASFCNRVSLFFIGDGVLQLVSDQRPEKVLARNYITTFGLLELYGVENYYLCAQSLAERGIIAQVKHVLSVDILKKDKLVSLLSETDHIFTF